MQLILETKPSIDVKIKMAELEESLDEKIISNGIENCIGSEIHKKDIGDGNKENIQSHDNTTIDDKETSSVNNDKILDSIIDISISKSNIKLDKEYEITEQSSEKEVICDNIIEENSLIFEDEEIIIIEDNKLESHINVTENQNVCNGSPVNQEIDKCIINDVEETECEENDISSEKELNNVTTTESEKHEELNIQCDKENDETIEIDNEQIIKESVSLKQAEIEKANIFLNKDFDVQKDISVSEPVSENDENVIPINKVASEEDNMNCSTREVHEKTDLVQLNQDAPENECLIQDLEEKTNEESTLLEQITEKEEYINSLKEDSNQEENLISSNQQLDSITLHQDAKDKDDSSQASNQLDVTENLINQPTEENNLVTMQTDDDNIPSSINNNTDVPEEAQSVKNIVNECNEEEKIDKENISSNISMDCDDITEIPSNESNVQISEDSKEDILDVDELNDTAKENKINNQEPINETIKETEVKVVNTPEKSDVEKRRPSMICKLSNTLDILSDDEEDQPIEMEGTQNKTVVPVSDKQCINIEDDDDVMLIDEDANIKDSKKDSDSNEVVTPQTGRCAIENNQESESIKILPDVKEKVTDSEGVSEDYMQLQKNDKPTVLESEKLENVKPLLPEDFLKSAKTNLGEMTRDDLEEFCILKIVEGVVDRSNLNEIKTKLKNMAQSMDEYRKKVMMLTKQNRDLQVVLKSIQEEQKKVTDTPITPLKITRSVGMQVLMTDKPVFRKKGIQGQVHTQLNNVSSNNKQIRNPTSQSPRPQKSSNPNQIIPVPKLVPVANTPIKATTNQINQLSNQGKTPSPIPNGIKTVPSSNIPTQKTAEKRTLNRTQSVTVDLTDDEPPSKIATRSSPAPPVRLVPAQNLMAPQRQQFGQNNSPRKVYIPISGPQGQNIRPGQTIMLKSVPGPRSRCPPPHLTRLPNNQIRMTKMQGSRHPAPLPDAMKQYQPPNWKALPPAPDLKLSKVENGIVISWKIEGYLDDSYEEIASYQLYAYQETSSPPSTTLWKKIGDVKALPLPMACTLTQFMSGFRYYFAVRAVDVRSRLGPFSLPGSILLLNKM